jgi:putative effector of murein hydrolase LrgA (UPF0299 family)
MGRTFFLLLLLLALRVGPITLLTCARRMLLSTLRMLHAPGVIALAVLISSCATRLCSVFVKFGGFVVIAVHHGSLSPAPSTRQYTRLWTVPGCHGMVWPDAVVPFEPRTACGLF